MIEQSGSFSWRIRLCLTESYLENFQSSVIMKILNIKDTFEFHGHVASNVLRSFKLISHFYEPGGTFSDSTS